MMPDGRDHTQLSLLIELRIGHSIKLGIAFLQKLLQEPLFVFGETLFRCD
jgi:hypothetical protein